MDLERHSVEGGQRRILDCIYDTQDIAATLIEIHDMASDIGHFNLDPSTLPLRAKKLCS